MVGLLEYTDYESVPAKEFEDIVYNALSKHFPVERQVLVPNRCDGRRGFLDLVVDFNGEKVPIEIDRKLPRTKSIFKVCNFNPRLGYVITRSPFVVFKYT